MNHKNQKIAVLLTNLGTPDFPTPFSISRFLREFLSDPRVIELPKLLWIPILYGLILPFRSFGLAKLYQKIWTKQGSPLKAILESQAKMLQTAFSQSSDNNIEIFYAMRYGNPSLEKVIKEISDKKIEKLLLLPLYPQYSASTSASTFDAVAKAFKNLRYQPELRVIQSYFDFPDYISALCERLKNTIKQYHPQKIVFSFHGLPQKMIDKGDPYEKQCQTTLVLIKRELLLDDDKIILSFQSRVGKAPWLKPYTDEIFKTLPKQNIKNVSVICPGFSADCLETLEEINERYRTDFITAGGEQFNFIPCLNDSEKHIKLLKSLIEKHTHHWL